jgi:hypothetical protein
LLFGGYDSKAYRVDHINGKIWDNRRSNLRMSTVSENGLHRTRLNANNVSGKTGVYQDRRTGKWLAEIFVSGVKYRLGRFDKLEDAIKARKAAEEKHAAGYESKT